MSGPSVPVIAAQQPDVGAHHDAAGLATTPAAWQWLVFAVWSCAGLLIAARKGWLDHARRVHWPMRPLGDQIMILGSLVISGVVAQLVLSLLTSASSAEPRPVASLLAMLSASAVTLGCWLAVRLPRAQRSPAHTTMPALTAAIAGLIGLGLAWPCVTLVANVGSALQAALGGAPAPDVAHLTLQSLRTHASDPAAWGTALAVVSITPLAEEVVWRGAVQQSLKRAGVPRLAAIGCSAALFAMVHWTAVPEAARMSALPALATLGFALGWLMERTGRLAAPVAAHAAFNAANLLLFSMLG